MLSKPGHSARFDILIAYDVRTQDAAGRRRLRQVAKICTAYGQRVQYSVFECTVNDTQFQRLESALTRVIHYDEDSLRIYRLRGARTEYLAAFGRDHYVDFSGPLIV